MKTWKTVSGVLSLVFFGFVAFQSCAAGVVDEYTGTRSGSGSAGLIVAIVMLVGGIINLSTRNTNGKGNTINFFLFGLAALVGYSNHGFFKDLIIWSTWCLANSIVAVADDIYIFATRNNQGANNYQQPQQPPYQPQPPYQQPPQPPYQLNTQPQPYQQQPQPPQLSYQQTQQLNSMNQGQQNNNMSDSGVDSETIKNIETIKKYKELLDMGAITQEEFDKKKQELL